MSTPQIVWYGDDFTGATDTLATAARSGRRALLFLRLPGHAQLAAAGPLDCIGIAGAARAMAPDAMRAELLPVADFFRASGARLLHYKTCSTFDSAPQVGNIAVAVQVLREAVGRPWAAIIGGQPSLGRYCLFGHLFAAAGSGGEVFRLDRHPTMSRHPVTPMHESDLRRHLALQGLHDVALAPYPSAGRLPALQAGMQAVLFDVADEATLAAVGQVLRRCTGTETLLAVGPSSVVQAYLGSTAAPGVAPALPAAGGPVLGLVGSLSPVTAAQVAAARSYRCLRLDPAMLALADAVPLRAEATRIAQALANGPVLACVGPPDAGAPRIDAQALARGGGTLLAQVLQQARPARVGIAGGDTSSLGVQALDAWGLSYRGDVGPGAPLCRLHSDRPGLDGLEIMLKGGQMGTEDVFERLLHGSP